MRIIVFTPKLNPLSFGIRGYFTLTPRKANGAAVSLLKVYDAQKNRALLISCYKEFKQRLFKEMGVEPQAETEKLLIKLLG